MNLRSSCLFFAAFAVGSSNANDIPSTAIAAGNFDTLVAALSATNLVDAVSQPGPFTVFAPTDEAFEQLPEGLVGCLLEEENLPILSDILLYHVVDGEAFSTDLTDGMEIKTLYGESVTVKIVDNGNTVLINGVEVVVPDVEATNGVIHIIDQVLVPDSIDVEGFYETCGFGTEEEKDVAKDVGGLVDIPTLAIENGNFELLVAALSATNLVDAISEPNGPFTVFAPTDDAFAALPDGVIECLLDNPKVLSDVLLYHVVSGEALSSDLSNGQRIPTLLSGAKVTVRFRNGGVRINKSDVIIPDVMASNGVVHVIDEVLVPGRHDINALCFPKKGSSSNMTGNKNNNRRPNQNNNRRATCHYQGVTVHAGQWHTGPTHTCYCGHNGHWSNCRPRRNNNHHGWSNNNNRWNNRWDNWWYGH